MSDQNDTIKETTCVRAGCFHSKGKHWVKTGSCLVEGCECLDFLETRETMPSDKQPHVHNYVYSYEKDFLVCACGAEADDCIFMSKEDADRKPSDRTIPGSNDATTATQTMLEAYKNRTKLHTGSRGGGKTETQLNVTVRAVMYQLERLEGRKKAGHTSVDLDYAIELFKQVIEAGK